MIETGLFVDAMILTVTLESVLKQLDKCYYEHKIL